MSTLENDIAFERIREEIQDALESDSALRQVIANR